MKNLLYVSLFLTLIACKNDDNPTAPVNELAQTWVLNDTGYVMADGQDISSDYTGFSINFIEKENENIFYVTNGEPAFPQSADTWVFADENENAIIRGSDQKEMDIILEDETLIMRFEMQSPSAGRMEGTYGMFEFKLNTPD